MTGLIFSEPALGDRATALVGGWLVGLRLRRGWLGGCLVGWLERRGWLVCWVVAWFAVGWLVGSRPVGPSPDESFFLPVGSLLK